MIIKPSQIARIDRAAASRTRTVWASLFQDDGIIRDVVGGQNLATAGASIVTPDGPGRSFNGTPVVSAPLAGLPPLENLAFIARVRANNAAQPGNPGAAFGMYAPTGNQYGAGIGFNGATVGVAWLTTNGAGLTAPVSIVVGQWYTVIVQSSAESSGAASRTWVHGVGNAVGSTSGGYSSPPTSLVLGGQTRDGGPLRQGRFDIAWAAILAGDSALWMTDEIANDLFASGYPYNLAMRERRLWPVSAPVDPAAEFEGRAAAQSSASGSLLAAILMRGAATAGAASQGVLASSIRLAGTASSSAAAAGALSTGISLIGSAGSTASASGALATDIRLAGSAQAQANASGAIVQAAGLSGAASASASAAGALTTGIRLAGSASATASAAGALAALGAGLAGAAQASASAAGSLETKVNLGGAASACATAAGQLLTAIQLSASATCEAIASGELSSTAAGFSGSAVAECIAAGWLTTQVLMSAMASAKATSTGRLAEPASAGTYPLAGQTQIYPLTGQQQNYPLAGLTQE